MEGVQTTEELLIEVVSTYCVAHEIALNMRDDYFVKIEAINWVYFTNDTLTIEEYQELKELVQPLYAELS